MGSGWLRESPRNLWPGNAWGAHDGKSALRKCMFLPVPEELRGVFPKASPALPPPARPPAPSPEAVVAYRNDPRHHVREFAAYPPGPWVDPRQALQQAHALQLRKAQKLAAGGAASTPRAWWDDPVALGTLLILVPPIGLAAVWSSKRYSNEARMALTVMTALTMCLMTGIVIAAIASR